MNQLLFPCNCKSFFFFNVDKLETPIFAVILGPRVKNMGNCRTILNNSNTLEGSGTCVSISHYTYIFSLWGLFSLSDLYFCWNCVTKQYIFLEFRNNIYNISRKIVQIAELMTLRIFFCFGIICLLEIYVGRSNIFSWNLNEILLELQAK